VVAVLLVWGLVSWAALVWAVKRRRMEDTIAPARVVLSPA